MALAQLAGNRAVLNRLRTMVSSERVPPSLLFTGPGGVGKLRAAVNFAKALNCNRAEPAQNDACDECPACLRIDQGSYPDVRRIGPEGPGGQVKADAVRQVVMDSPFRPFEGKKRVYLFEHADRMNPTAANTLLKTLEEPPPWTVLILLTTNEAAILPTLLSRCQKIRFLPLQPQEVIDTLVGEHGTPRPRARLAAGVAGGNISRALTLVDEVEALHDEAYRIARVPTEGAQYSQILSWAGELAKNSQLPIILRLTVCLLRDFASIAAGSTPLHSDVSGELESDLHRVPLDVLLNAYLRVEEAIQDLEFRYTNKRITIEQMLIQLDRTARRTRGSASSETIGATRAGRAAI